MEWSPPSPVPERVTWGSDAILDDGTQASLRLHLDDDQTWTLFAAAPGLPWRPVGWGSLTIEPSPAVADAILFAALADPDVQAWIAADVDDAPPWVPVEFAEPAPVEEPPSRLVYAEDVQPGAVIAVGDHPTTWAQVLSTRERGNAVTFLLDVGGEQSAIMLGAIQPVRLRVDP